MFHQEKFKSNAFVPLNCVLLHSLIRYSVLIKIKMLAYL